MRNGSLRTTLAAVATLMIATSFNAAAGPVLQKVSHPSAKATLKLACSTTATLEVEDWRGSVFGNDLFFLVSLLSRHDIEIDIARVPRTRGIVDARNGKYDGLCSCLSNEKLEETFHHSQPLGYISIGVISNRGSEQRLVVKHPRKRHRRPVRWGAVSSDGLKSFLNGEGITEFTLLESHEQGYRMLELGRIDKLAVLGASVRRHSKKAIFRLKFQYRELARPTLHFCLSGTKGKEIIDMLDGSLSSYRLIARQ